MIKLVPELPHNDINLKVELPIVDRYHAIMEGVDTTIYELNQFRNKDYAIGIEFGLYEGIHGSLISDYMSAVTDTVEGEPPLVVMSFNGGPDRESASTDFETITSPERMQQYDDVVRWLLENHGAEVNLKVHLQKAPNPYASFSSGPIRFISPFSDSHTMKITNPRYLDIFGFVNSMLNQFGNSNTVVLNEIISLGKHDGVPEYTCRMTDGNKANSPSLQQNQ
jgi:hypothetical protein